MMAMSRNLHVMGSVLSRFGRGVTNDPTWVPNKKGRAGLWLAVGHTAGGRALTVPVAYDHIRREIRPITGWNSTTGEQARYL
jgi:hypothetical protein